jgi:hypothetical protein
MAQCNHDPKVKVAVNDGRADAGNFYQGVHTYRLLKIVYQSGRAICRTIFTNAVRHNNKLIAWEMVGNVKTWGRAVAVLRDGRGLKREAK